MRPRVLSTLTPRARYDQDTGGANVAATAPTTTTNWNSAEIVHLLDNTEKHFAEVTRAVEALVRRVTGDNAKVAYSVNDVHEMRFTLDAASLAYSDALHTAVRQEQDATYWVNVESCPLAIGGHGVTAGLTQHRQTVVIRKRALQPLRPGWKNALLYGGLLSVTLVLLYVLWRLVRVLSY